MDITRTLDEKMNVPKPFYDDGKMPDTHYLDIVKHYLKKQRNLTIMKGTFPNQMVQECGDILRYRILSRIKISE